MHRALGVRHTADPAPGGLEPRAVAADDGADARPWIEAPGHDVGLGGRADHALHAAAGGPRGRAELRAHAATAGTAVGHPHGSCLVRGEPDDPVAERGVTVGGTDVGEEQQPGRLGGHRGGDSHLVVVERGQRIRRVVAVHDRQQPAPGRLPQQLAKIRHGPRRRQVTAGHQDLADLHTHRCGKLPVQRHQRGLAYRGGHPGGHGLRPGLGSVVLPQDLLQRRDEPLVAAGAPGSPAVTAFRRHAQRGTHGANQRLQGRSRPGGRPFEGEQPPPERGSTGRDQDDLVTGSLRHRNLADQACDDIERQPVAARDRARPELDDLSGHRPSRPHTMTAPIAPETRVAAGRDGRVPL